MSTTDSPHFKKLYRDFVPILGQIFSTESLTLVCAMLAEESLEARKALAPFDPSAGWLPIASVPRDESMVFVDAPDMDCGVTIAYYKRTGGAHLGLNGKPFMPHAAQPTHWQPLPAPPEERK